MSNEIINDSNEKERLTIEELRKFKGNEHLSDKQAKQVSDILFDIAMFLYNHEI